MGKKEEEIADKLAAPFAPPDLIWHPLTANLAKGATRAQCIPFIVANAIVERLNRVLGIGGWSDLYNVLNPNEIECNLTLYLGDNPPISRAGVGVRNILHNGTVNAAPVYGDALRAAAWKFGVGAYISRLPPVLMGEIDANTQRIVTPPALPSWAIPEEWNDCGEAFAKQLAGMLNQCATESKTAPDSVQERIFKAHGYDPKTNPANIKLIHARGMLQDLKTWLETMAKKQTSPKESARPGAGSTVGGSK